MVRRWFYIGSTSFLAIVLLLALVWPSAPWSLVVIGPLLLVGIHDSLQRKHTLLRNFPVIGHVRYFLEMVRPEIQQYFIENKIDAFTIKREFRSIVYQRAKGELETRPLGAQRNFYREMEQGFFGEQALLFSPFYGYCSGQSHPVVQEFPAG